jgi:hypothetical protein
MAVSLLHFTLVPAASISAPSADHGIWWSRAVGYGADLDSISLIEPSVSLAAIRRHIPDLEWAKYPRSITTPPLEISDRIRVLISTHKKRFIDLDDDFLAACGAHVQPFRGT